MPPRPRFLPLSETRPRPDLRRRRLAAALLASPLAIPSAAPAHPHTPLRLGLVPFLTARQMIGVFEPLRAHLEANLKRPVRSYTAASLRALAENMKRGDYDLAFMPVHFMRLAAQDWGATVVARTRTPADVVLAAAAGHALEVPAGLRGGRVVALDGLAIGSMVAVEWLREQGLEPGRDVTVEYIVAANSVMLALQRSDVTAIALIEATMADMAPALRATVQVVARMRTVPSPGWVIARSVPAAEHAAIRASLLSFVGAPGADGSLSRAALEPVSLAETADVERYSARLRALLAEQA